MRFFNYIFTALMMILNIDLSAQDARLRLSPHNDIVGGQMQSLSEDENSTLLGRWAKGSSKAVAADGDGQIYFGDGSRFVIGAISGSGQIVEKGSVILPGELLDIDIPEKGNYIYAAMGYAGVAIIDVSALSEPQLVKVLTNADSKFDAQAVKLDGSSLYIAAGADGLLRAEINSIDDIVFDGVYKYKDCSFRDVDARNDTVFTASGNNALEMLYFTNGDFKLLNHVNYNKYTQDYQNQTPMAFSVIWHNDSLFIADSWTGVFFFTAEDTALTHIDHALGSCTGLAVEGSRVFVTDYTNINTFLIKNNNFESKDHKEVKLSKSAAVSGNYVTVAGESYGIYSFAFDDQLNLTEKDYYANGSKTFDVFQQGYYLYRISPSNMIKVIAAMNPAEPKTAAELQLDENKEGRLVYVEGDTIISCAYDPRSGGSEIYISSLDDFYSPQQLASWNTANSINDILLKGKNIYLAMGNDLVILDFSDINNISEKGRVTTSGWIEDIAIHGNYIFTASEDAGMSVIDVADKMNPKEKAVYKQSDETYYLKIRTQGAYAYIANGGKGLTILNIENPESPVMAGTYTDIAGGEYFNADQLAVYGNYAYLHRSWGEIIFLNIKDPNNPILKGIYNLSSVGGMTAYSRNVSVYNTATGIYLVANDNSDALPPCHAAGEVSGKWECPKIYLEDDITIPAGDTLIITDKVKYVVALGPYQIKVEGVLLANGPQDGRVGLYGEDILFSGNKWKGIYFNNLNDSGAGTSVISHCRFDNADKMDMTYQGGGAIAIYNSDNVVVKNCTFYQNRAKLGGAVYIENANPVFENCYFEVNGRGGVNLSELKTEGGGAMYIKNSAPELYRLRFLKNGAHGGGAIVFDNASPIVRNVLIEHNIAGGIGGGVHCINGASPRFVNLTSADNTAQTAGGSFYLNNNCNSVIINSILYGNSKPEIYADGAVPVVTYSIVDSASGESWFGEGCLTADPLFDESGNIDYHLKSVACGNASDSPAIDAGHPDSLDSYLDCSAGLGGSRADMGYYGGRFSLLPTFVAEDRPENIPSAYELEQNYPNPFNPVTTIRFNIPESGHVTLKIYNVLGEEVSVLSDRKMNAGMNEITFNAENLSSGIYFYRLSVKGVSGGHHNKFTSIKKMILLK